MSNYKQALQNFLRNLFSVQWKLRGVWNDLYKLCSMSSGNLHGKEFSDMYLQRTDERSKRGSIAVGCFAGCEPMNEPSGSQELGCSPGFAIHSKQHQTKTTEQRTHYLVWKIELVVLLVFSEPFSVCDRVLNCYPERQRGNFQSSHPIFSSSFNILEPANLAAQK